MKGFEKRFKKFRKVSKCPKGLNLTINKANLFGNLMNLVSFIFIGKKGGKKGGGKRKSSVPTIYYTIMYVFKQFKKEQSFQNW